MTDPHDTPVHLTPRALAIAVGVRDDEGLRDHRLRARVLGGGCRGFQFDLFFDDEMDPADTVIRCEGLDVIVDMMSIIYLDGVTIDYVEGLHGAGFKFVLPQSAGACGGCASAD